MGANSTWPLRARLTRWFTIITSIYTKKNDEEEES
jgi:hypothetical protein